MNYIFLVYLLYLCLFAHVLVQILHPHPVHIILKNEGAAQVLVKLDLIHGKIFQDFPYINLKQINSKEHKSVFVLFSNTGLKV